MNTKIVFAMFIGLFILLSCNRKNNVPQPLQAPAPMQSFTTTGEDEDKKILMKVSSFNYTPIFRAVLMFTNEGDTVKGITDADGKYLATLPRPGEWHVIVTHEAFDTYTATIDVTDSFAEQNCTMVEK